MANDRDRRPPDGSEGQPLPLPELPAEAQKQIIIAAAAVSGKPANEITLAEALEILQGDNPNPYLNAAMNKAAEDAAGALFAGMTDEQIEELTEAAKDGRLQEGLTAALMEFIRQMQDGSETPAADQGQDGETPIKENPATAADDPDEPGVIRIETQLEYDPALDPNSPDFDPQKWKEATAGAGERLQETAKRLNNSLANVYKGLFKAADVGSAIAAQVQEMQASFSGITETMIKAMQGAQAAARFSQSETWQQIRDTIAEIAENAPLWLEIATEIAELQPFIEAELKKPEYEGKTFDELYETGIDEETGDIIPDSLFAKLIEAARTARKTAEILPQLQSAGTPKYYTSPNTTLSNALQANDGKGEVIGAGAIDLPVLNVGTSKEVTILVDATLENMDGLTMTGKPFTEYDRAVHDAVVSLYEDRKKKQLPTVISADMVYRTMTHKTSTEKVSPQQRGAVTKSIEKMRRNIYIKADVRSELQKRNITAAGNPIEECTIDNFMLSAERMTVKAGGEKVEAYLLQEPILLKYAKMTGQLFTVKGELLDIKEVDGKGKITTVSLSNNENRIAAKSYLLRRVEVMRNDENKAIDANRKYQNRKARNKDMPVKNVSDFRKQQRVILFESLFSATGIAAVNSKTKIKDFVYSVLDYWKATGNIKGYKKRKKGKSIDAVIIEI